MLVTQEDLFGLKHSPQSSASLLTHNIEFPALSATFSHFFLCRFEISSLKLRKIKLNKKKKDLCFRNLQRTIKSFKGPTKTGWPGHCLLPLASAWHWLKALEVTAQRGDVIGPAPPDLRLWQTKSGVVTVPDLRYWYSINFLFSLPPHLLSPAPHPSLWLPPCGCCGQDVQPDHRPVPLQGWRHWHHLQPLRQRLPAEPLPRRPLHQWVTNTPKNIIVAG